MALSVCLACSLGLGQIPTPPAATPAAPVANPRPADLFVYYLGWRWSPGDRHRYDLEVRESLEVSRESGSNESANSVARWRVSDRVVGPADSTTPDDGIVSVERTFDRVGFELRHPLMTGDEAVQFEIEQPGADEDVPAMFRSSARMVGRSLRFDVDSMGRVYDASYVDRDVAGVPPVERWIPLLDGTMALAPGADVVLGDTWTASMELPLASGPLRVDRLSKLKSIRRGAGERVGVISMLAEPMEAIDQTQPPPVEVGRPRLDTYAEHGEAMFDLVRGHALRVQLKSLARFRVRENDGSVTTHWLRREINLERIDEAAKDSAEPRPNLGPSQAPSQAPSRAPSRE